MGDADLVEKYFKKEELIQILKGLIRRKSQNPIDTEEESAKFVQQLLCDNGIPAELSWAGPGRPNVIAKVTGSQPGPVLLYNGHLDVVPAGLNWKMDPFEGIIRDGKMYGRGAADMKSGVAAMIYAAILMKRMDAPESGQLMLFFDVDEERENLGIKKYLAEDWNADFAVIGEPTNLDLAIGHKGIARYRLITEGTPGHASFIREPDNAIYKMAKLINTLEELSFSIKQKVHPILGQASLSVTQVNGGLAPNIIPDFCEIEIDRRILTGEDSIGVLREIEECLRHTAKKFSFEYQLLQYLFSPASYIEKSHPLVKEFSKSILKVRKQKARIKVFEAFCEAPFFSVNKGIPTVICGPGSLEQAHIADEYVELNQVVEAALLYADIAMRLLHG